MKSVQKLKKFLSCVGVLLAIVSCAQLGDPHAVHPLVGKVWDVAAHRFVDPAVVIERATAARFVLLGEIHDNAEHHRIQSRILDEVLKSGRRPALVLEQYDIDQQEQLSALTQDKAEQRALPGLAELMRKGWNWAYYEPIVSAGLRQKLELIAANLSRETLREVTHKGYEALGAGSDARLKIEAVWSPERQQQLLQDVALGHCGKLPEHVVPMIAKSQRARDAVMADMLLKSKQDGGIALFGRGHTRYDMGVPLYLAAREPKASLLSVGLIEVDTPTDPAAYARGPLGVQHDYLWFTKRAPRQSDPCDSIPAKPKALWVAAGM